MDPQTLLEPAVAAAVRAGEMLSERFGGPPGDIETKSSPTDVVSDADRKAQQLITDILIGARPEDGLMGEEGGERTSRSGVTWVVDPLDGTVNFLFGIPVWAVSVAATEQGETVCAVVRDPSLDETYTAIKGSGARCNGEPIAVGRCTRLGQALVGTGFSYDAEVRAAQAEVAARVLPRVRDIRRAGSAALDLCSVALGRLDAYYEADVKTWDRAAGELIVREAGGRVTSLDIHRATHGVGGILAANPSLCESLGSLLTEATTAR